jgi:hypothetical protein
MRSTLVLCGAFLCAAVPGAGRVQAASGLTAAGVVLLQPERVMEARISVNELAPYLKQVDAAATRALDRQQAVPASAGFLVVAIRPGARSKVWLDFKPPLPKAVADALTAGTEAVRAPATTGATVAIAMKYSIGGAPAPSQPMPAPAEWTAAAKAAKQALTIEELIDRIWK